MPLKRLRPLGVMILATLAEGDMHPYEMQRLLRSRGDERLVSLQNGTFYHQIAALLADGFIAEASVERDGNRPQRTVYTLLPAGVAAVEAWCRDRLARTDSDADFRVALAEAHNLPRDEVVRLLDVRVTSLRTELAALDDGVGAARARAVGEQFLVELDRDMVLRQADITWTIGLRDAIADGTLAWGAPGAPAPRKDGA